MRLPCFFLLSVPQIKVIALGTAAAATTAWGLRDGSPRAAAAFGLAAAANVAIVAHTMRNMMPLNNHLMAAGEAEKEGDASIAAKLQQARTGLGRVCVGGGQHGCPLRGGGRRSGFAAAEAEALPPIVKVRRRVGGALLVRRWSRHRALRREADPHVLSPPCAGAVGQAAQPAHGAGGGGAGGLPVWRPLPADQQVKAAGAAAGAREIRESERHPCGAWPPRSQQAAGSRQQCGCRASSWLYCPSLLCRHSQEEESMYHCM